ncbi:MAG: alanine--glyoxylate aminotransferase family protein [Burkholderiales bacterium]|nr:alanine--glyoxylate aminotransferase family protein [Burkholderiales bacterium]
MSSLNTPPVVDSLDTLLPPEPLLMMGAGPVPIPARVAQANSIVINHLGETMARVIEQMKAMARYVFQTASPWVLGVAGPGSAAMEMSVCNLVRPGTRVLSVVNGYFSRRLGEMSQRVGGVVEYLEMPEGQSASAEAVRAALLRHRPEVLTIVQGETSSTLLTSELPAICRLAREHGCYVIVDAVCTLSTMPLLMDEWCIDAVVTGGQKGLASIPGVSLIAFSERAWQRIESRPVEPAQWCLDAKLAANFWHNASYHYTAPVSGILALHEALHLICQETLPERFERHLRCSLALQRGIEGMGLALYAAPAARLNSVVGVRAPAGVDRRQVCSHISRKYRVEISGSFGLDIVRIGQMGEQCREHHLFRTLHALGQTMKDLGAAVDVPTGVAELERELQRQA